MESYIAGLFYVGPDKGDVPSILTYQLTLVLLDRILQGIKIATLSRCPGLRIHSSVLRGYKRRTRRRIKINKTG